MNQWSRNFTKAVLNYAKDNPNASFAEIESRFNGGTLNELIKGFIYDVRFTKRKISEALYLFMAQKEYTHHIIKYIEGMKILNPVYGLIPFDLYPYQKEILEEFEKNDRILICKGRQMGITTLSLAYAVYYADKNPDSNILIISYKYDISKLQRQRANHLGMSKGIQGGSIQNKYMFSFANGSRLKFSNTNRYLCSETFDLIVLDEAAYIPKMKELWTAMIPCIVNAKVIVHSTPNYSKQDWFANQWHRNGFKKFKITWDMHPNLTQQWRDDQDGLGIHAKCECDAEFI